MGSKIEKNELKKKIFQLVDEDEEFRYAIAGKLGLKDISTKQNVHDQKFNEIMAQLRVNDQKFNEMITEIRANRSEIVANRSEIVANRSEIVANRSEIVANRSDIREIKTSIDRMMVSLEDEAHEVIEYLLKVNHVVDITLSVMYENDLEIDIYGVSDDICVIGDVSVRLGSGMIRDLLKKVKYLKKSNSSKLRKKVVLVLYGVKILPQIIEEAEKSEIWLVTATKELTKISYKVD